MKRFPRLIAIFSIILLLTTGCRKQPPMAEKMARPFQETIDQQRGQPFALVLSRYQLELPGISAAVSLPDGSTWLGVSGKSSDREAMDSGMLFGLASASKTYIGALVAQLEAEGSLSVDDPISRWIPELGRMDGDITIWQLLHHTSGLYRYQQKPAFLTAIDAQPGKIWTPQEILKEFQGEPECQPGQCFGESAMDYVLLGMIIEKATGTSVSSQLSDRFFKPLGLDHTFLYPQQVYPIEKMAHMWWDVSGNGEPVDVVEGAGELPLASLWSALWASGSIHTTAGDLARFTRNLFEGRAIRPDALEKMLTPGPEIDPGVTYGYSVVIEKMDGKTVYWHTGGAGYASIYFYVPEDRISIAVLGNLMVNLQPVAVALYEAYQDEFK